MPKLDCPCGFQHNLGAEENSFVVVPQKHYPRLLEIEKEYARLDPRSTDYAQRAKELDLQRVSLKSRLVECPSCGRVTWFRGEAPIVYWMDDE
jgi:hypothetical protein